MLDMLSSMRLLVSIVMISVLISVLMIDLMLLMKFVLLRIIVVIVLSLYDWLSCRLLVVYRCVVDIIVLRLVSRFDVVYMNIWIVCMLMFDSCVVFGLLLIE